MFFKEKFFNFYSLQLFSLILNMCRATAYGIILSNLNISSSLLSLTASAFSFFAILGFYSSSFIIKKIGENNLFLMNQIAFIFLSFLSILCFIYFNNIYIWIALSCIPSFFGSLEAISRPNYVIINFSNKGIKNIVKNDIFLMGSAKIMGFMLGNILGLNLIIHIFILSIIVNLIFFSWMYHNTSIKHKIKLQAKKFNIKYILHELKKFLYLDFLIGFFIFPINTQAITIAKINNINFINILIVSSIGNLAFNEIFRSSIKIKNIAICGIITFLFTILSLTFLNGNIILISYFFMGATYSTLLVISKGSIQNHFLEHKFRNEYIAFSFIIYSIFNILGTIYFGYLLSNIAFNSAIYFYFITFLIYLTIFKNKIFIN